jgi:hypothetical protein
VRFVTLAVAAMLATSAAVTAGIPQIEWPDKPEPRPVPPDCVVQPGDTIETAIEILSLPCSLEGTTIGYADDYDVACPYPGSVSPDVVFRWTASSTVYLNICTCGSNYDTKLYVYEDGYTAGRCYACNDDSADCPGPPYRSSIGRMPATAGNTYYIVVDGYGGGFGRFLLEINEVAAPELCALTRPPVAFDEHEPRCHDGYVDATNCGRLVHPALFQHPALNTEILGTSGNYDGNARRDTDWFEFVLEEPLNIEYCICADFPVRIWILEPPCGMSCCSVLATAGDEPFCEVYLERDLAPGTYYFVVSTDGWRGVPCGSEYVARVSESGYAPVERASWGTLKAMYR